MKKTSILVAICIFFLVLLPTVFAIIPYGGYNGFVNDGTSIFGSSVDFTSRTTTYTRTLSDTDYIPLTADLDGDGTIEIFVLDSGSIRIYQDKTLTIVDAYTIPVGSSFTPLVSEDIDGDGKEEIITVNLDSPHIAYFIEWNGSAIFQDANVTLDGSLATVGEGVVGCGTNSQCIYAQATRNTINTGSTDGLNIVAFNKTSSLQNTIFGTASGGKVCLPQIPIITYGDHDNNGIDSFMFSTFTYSPSSTDTYVISIINDDLSPALDDSISKNAPISFANQGNGVSCSNLYRNTGNAEPLARYSFTSPLIFNADGASSNGLEFIMGFDDSATEYNMVAYDSSGSELDIYPDAFFGGFEVFGYSVDGFKLGNVYRADIFTDSGNNDFCVNGHDTNGISAICASLVTTNNFNDGVWFFSPYTSTNFNVSFDYGSWDSYTMVSNTGTSASSILFADSQMITGNGIYGFSNIDENDAYIVSSLDNDRAMTFINENPKGLGSMIIDDATNVSHQDLMVLSTSNLFYIDDNFVNTPGQITSVCINPDPSGTLKLNTTMSIQVKVEDINGDNVRAKAIIYDGDSAEQDSGFTSYAVSGTTFSFGFDINATRSNAVISVLANDIENNLTLDRYNRTFSVGTYGAEFGDSEYCDVFELLDTNVTGTATSNVNDASTDNVISDTLNSTLFQSWGLGNTLLWILFMFIVAVAIFWELSSNPIVALVSVVFIETLLLIMGIILGYISVAYLIMLLLVMVVVAGITLGKIYTGHGG